MKENFKSIQDEVNKFTNNMKAGWTELTKWSKEATALQAKFEGFLKVLKPFIERFNSAKEKGVNVENITGHTVALLKFETDYTDNKKSISNKSAVRKEFSEIIDGYIYRGIRSSKSNT